MARVILDVPTDKMQSFLQAILNLGIDSHAISSYGYHKQFRQQKRRKAALKEISHSFILFDWEFFSNELEYE